jgi:hypothetical protein
MISDETRQLMLGRLESRGSQFASMSGWFVVTPAWRRSCSKWATEDFRSLDPSRSSCIPPLSMAVHTCDWPWDMKRKVSNNKWKLSETSDDEMAISNACIYAICRILGEGVVSKEGSSVGPVVRRGGLVFVTGLAVMQELGALPMISRSLGVSPGSVISY